MRSTKSLLFILVGCAGCIDPYIPKLKDENLGALVVDGYIDLDGSAFVRLSRSIEVNAEGDPIPEKGADVIIKSSEGNEYNLEEGDMGTYIASDIPVGVVPKYTLYVKTSDGREYQSDDVSVYPTPAIDSLYFTVAPSNEAIEINVNARDDNEETTGYYLWDCVETYEYHAYTYSGYKFVDHQVIERTPEEQIYKCWHTFALPPVVTSTRRLGQNVINAQTLQVISKGSEKFTARYSLLVKQRVISEDEYNFRVQLQKSTQTTGGLFAPIPGAVVGNVHSLDGHHEYVLGYFRGQESHERRFFIDLSDLPQDFQVSQPNPGCLQELTCPIGEQGGFNCIPVDIVGDVAVITQALTVNGVPIAYYYVSPTCGDCRYQGGVVDKPDFW